jgi:hypothetical protein
LSLSSPSPTGESVSTQLSSSLTKRDTILVSQSWSFYSNTLNFLLSIAELELLLKYFELPPLYRIHAHALFAAALDDWYKAKVGSGRAAAAPDHMTILTSSRMNALAPNPSTPPVVEDGLQARMQIPMNFLTEHVKPLTASLTVQMTGNSTGSSQPSKNSSRTTSRGAYTDLSYV